MFSLTNAAFHSRSLRSHQIEHQLDEMKLAAANTISPIRILSLIIWTLKSLAMRNHRKTSQFIDRLLSYADDAEVGRIAAGGFDIVMRDSEEVS